MPPNRYKTYYIKDYGFFLPEYFKHCPEEEFGFFRHIDDRY